MVTSFDKILENNEGVIDSQPFLQVLNVPKSPNEDLFGLFITLENAEACGFQPSNEDDKNYEWMLHEHQFSESDIPTEGYLCRRPCLYVINESQLAIIRDGKYLCDYNKPRYEEEKQKAGKEYVVAAKKKYCMIVTDCDGTALHQGSLKFNTGGYFGTSFGQAFDKFKSEFGKAIKSPRRNDAYKFWRYVKFCPIIKPTKQGQSKNSMSFVSTVVDYEHVTSRSEAQLIYTSEENLVQQIESEYEIYKDYRFKPKEVEAMPTQQTVNDIKSEISSAVTDEYNTEADYDFLVDNDDDVAPY